MVGIAKIFAATPIFRLAAELNEAFSFIDRISVDIVGLLTVAHKIEFCQSHTKNIKFRQPMHRTHHLNNFESFYDLLYDINGVHRRSNEPNSVFKAKIQTGKFEYINVCSIDASPYSSEVTDEMLSKPGRKNLFLLLLCAEGGYELRQDGRNGQIGPGGVALMDTRLPGFCGAAQGAAGSFLTIPVDIWEQFAPPPSAHGEFIPSLALTTVRLARGLAMELAAGGEDVGAEHKATLARQMVEILAIAATEASEHLPGSMHRQMVLRRIKSYIRNKISDSDLSPLTISQNFSISKRYLSKLFQEEQMTVMDYIMTQRITMAKELLLQSKTSQSSIKDIAYRVGFRTPSHFSSTFSALLDMTPSDYAKGRTNSAGR